MKKTLLAVAVAAALPAAAFAQVTMYGVADVGVQKVTGAKEVGAQMTAGNGSSRLGVKGTEDLGGGLKVSFNYEMYVNIENGGSDTDLFQRAAFLQVDSNYGSLRMGRSLSPSFYGVAAYELTGTANYCVICSTFGYAGGAARNVSEWRYTTPNFSGLTATLGYVAKQDYGQPNDKIDANVIYKNGPIVVALSYNKAKNESDAGYALGGKYNFGMFEVAASAVDQGEADGGVKGFTLGAGADLGPVHVVLDVARVTTSGKESTNYLLEGKYPLSKRTFLYAAVRRMDLADETQTTAGIRHNF